MSELADRQRTQRQDWAAPGSRGGRVGPTLSRRGPSRTEACRRGAVNWWCGLPPRGVVIWGYT